MHQIKDQIGEDFSPKRGTRVLRIIGMTFVGVVFAVAFALVFGFLVKWLWNWIMPAVFGLGQITYWQAFGIVVLAKLLFGGFGPHHRDHSDRFHNKFRSHWEGFASAHDPGKSHLSADRRSWGSYREFWNEEGRAAFEDYIRRKKDQGSTQNS